LISLFRVEQEVAVVPPIPTMCCQGAPPQISFWSGASIRARARPAAGRTGVVMPAPALDDDLRLVAECAAQR
jgi:hypothetical protein